MWSDDERAQTEQEPVRVYVLNFLLAFMHSDEMIYDDVENGDEGGNSSLEYGWSSSEFESYEEQSDSESRNGVPQSFLRSDHKKQVRVQCVCLRDKTFSCGHVDGTIRCHFHSRTILNCGFLSCCYVL